MTSDHLERLKVSRMKDEALLEGYNRSKDPLKDKAIAETRGRTGTENFPPGAGRKDGSSNRESGGVGGGAYQGSGRKERGSNQQRASTGSVSSPQAGGRTGSVQPPSEAPETLSNQELSMIEAMAYHEREQADMMATEQSGTDFWMKQQEASLGSLDNAQLSAMAIANIQQQAETNVTAGR